MRKQGVANHNKPWALGQMGSVVPLGYKGESVANPAREKQLRKSYVVENKRRERKWRQATEEVSQSMIPLSLHWRDLQWPGHPCPPAPTARPQPSF